MYVQTESPIFDNIEQIASKSFYNLDQDQRKFTKKLNALGMGHLAYKLQKSNKALDEAHSIIRPTVKVSNEKTAYTKSSN